MRTMAVIAKSAIKEHSRCKLIFAATIVSLITMAVLLYFAATQDQAAVLFGRGGDRANGLAIATFASLGFLGIFAVFVALAVSMGNVGQPFSNGEATLVLARPVDRWQYALGRLAASIVIVVGFCALVAVEMQIVSVVGGGGISVDLWGHWASAAFNLSVLVTLTTLLSTFISIPIVVAVISFFVNQLIGGVALLHILVRLQSSNLNAGTSAAIETLWYITPKFLQSPLTLRAASGAGHGTGFLMPHNSPGMTAWAIGYLAGIVLLIV
ncbi:MAG: hypothetical protein ABIS18_11415, partial [Actinomycetota bacterium]